MYVRLLPKKRVKYQGKLDMHPKNRMEKAVALEAIADAAEKMEKSGASPIDVTAFVTGARGKLTEERPDPDKYAKAALSSYKWAKSNEQ